MHARLIAVNGIANVIIPIRDDNVSIAVYDILPNPNFRITLRLFLFTVCTSIAIFLLRTIIAEQLFGLGKMHMRVGWSMT